MRFLHTADWHVGKKLGRLDRLDESARVLDEVVAIAADQKVDAVLVAGDLFDRAGPPTETLRLVIQTLVRLSAEGAKVVVLPGNHDSPDLFSVLGPLLNRFDVFVVHKPLEPDAGAVVEVPSRDGKTTARVACLPFVNEIQVIDLKGLPEEGFKTYSDRINKITHYYGSYLARTAASHHVDILMGHFMIHGAHPSGSERELHIGEAFATTPEALPNTLKYAALGHIHEPQEAPGSSIPSRYSGSLMQLDFGEAGREKSVCIVDVQPGMKPARVTTLPITSGTPLIRVRDTRANLQTRVAELEGAILDVWVQTEGPEPGLAEEIRAFLPGALNVHADYERAETETARREDATLDELYEGYWIQRHGAPPSEEIVAAFAELRNEVGATW